MTRDFFHEFHYEKAIFHIDVNSAFLSWTAVDRLRKDPKALDLRTVPSVIGGDEETRHGIVSAKSIPAKKYGIHTADTVASALRKCPDLIVAKADFKLYREFSHAFLDILRSYTPLVEQASIDEAYMDVTGLEKEYSRMRSVPEIGQRPRKNEETAARISNGRQCIADGADGQTPGKIAEGAECVGRGNGIARVHSSSETARELEKPDAVELPFPINLAYEIKNRVRDTLGFTVNVGISSNKLLAKTASDFTKPDRVHTLWPAEIQEKYWPMPIGEMFGCGRATADRLNEIGIQTIGDAAATDEKVLQSFLGEKGGEYVWKSANGIGSTRVRAEQEDAKGYSNETTIEHDITAANFEAEAPFIVRDLAEHVAARLKRDGVYAATVGIIARTDAFRRHTRQKTLSESTNNGEILYKTAMTLLRTLAFGVNGNPGLFGEGRGIRLLGVSATKLDAGAYRQMSLFDMMGSASSVRNRKSEKSVKPTSGRTIEGEKAQPARDGEMKPVKGNVPKKVNGVQTSGADKKNARDIGSEKEDEGRQRRCGAGVAETESGRETNRDEKARHLAEMLGRIRSAYGESAVMSGAELLQRRDGHDKM